MLNIADTYLEAKNLENQARTTSDLDTTDAESEDIDHKRPRLFLSPVNRSNNANLDYNSDSDESALNFDVDARSTLGIGINARQIVQSTVCKLRKL